MDPASYTDEKYALFDKYQKTIHHDHKSSPSDFRRFLVDSPLQVFLSRQLLLILSLSYNRWHLFHIRNLRQTTCRPTMALIINFTDWMGSSLPLELSTSCLPASRVSISFMTRLGSNSHLARWQNPYLRVSMSTHYTSQLSALREVSLACEMHNAGAPQMGFLYMGQCLLLVLFRQVFNIGNQVSTFIPVRRCDIKGTIHHLI